MTPNTSNVERAEDVIAGVPASEYGTGYPCREMAYRLNSAGLLARHSPEAEALRDKAAEACMDLARQFTRSGDGPCLVAGRALLALADKERGPKWKMERWKCSDGYSHPWRVWNEDERGHLDYKFRTEAEARAVAAALNEVPR